MFFWYIQSYISYILSSIYCKQHITRSAYSSKGGANWRLKWQHIFSISKAPGALIRENTVIVCGSQYIILQRRDPKKFSYTRSIQTWTGLHAKFQTLMSFLAQEMDFFVVVSDRVNTLSRLCHTAYHSDKHSSLFKWVDFFFMMW